MTDPIFSTAAGRCKARFPHALRRARKRWCRWYPVYLEDSAWLWDHTNDLLVTMNRSQGKSQTLIQPTHCCRLACTKLSKSAWQGHIEGLWTVRQRTGTEKTFNKRILIQDEKDVDESELLDSSAPPCHLKRFTCSNLENTSLSLTFVRCHNKRADRCGLFKCEALEVSTGLGGLGF